MYYFYYEDQTFFMIHNFFRYFVNFENYVEWVVIVLGNVFIIIACDNLYKTMA